MQLPQEIRERFDADDIPPQAYALVGAALMLKQRSAVVLRAAGRVAALPGEAADAVRRLQSAPAQLRAGYAAMEQEGERAVAHWHAERIINERADRITRAMTPKAARASVSARDAARRAAGSPTGQKLGEAGRRARRGAGQAWRDYLATVEEAGAAQWGDAAMNGAPGASPLR